MKVVEIFGPTVQGEGPHAGRVTHFVRFGGCDFRCSWCDTPQAVDPALVRQAEDLSVPQIVDRLAQLAPAPMLVLSGGNPALWHLDGLLDALPDYRIAVETQGSRWRDWLHRVDSLVVSPKPPSSGEATERNLAQLERFMAEAIQHPGAVLKIVVFDEADLQWAHGIAALYPALRLYLSVGTDQDGASDGDTVLGVAERYRWLCERVAGDPTLHAATVLPQLHVIAWGHRVGV